MSIKVSVKDRKISKSTAMGRKLEIFGEVRIIDETNGFGLEFFKKTKSGFWSATQDAGAVLLRRTDLGLVYS